MRFDRVSIGANQIPANASSAQIKNMLKNQICESAKKLAEELCLDSRIDPVVLICCLDRFCMQDAGPNGREGLLEPSSGEWTIGVCVDKGAAGGSEVQSAIHAYESISVCVNNTFSYLKATEQWTSAQGDHSSLESEGIHGEIPGKVSFGRRTLTVQGRTLEETGRFMDNPAIPIHGLEEGLRKTPDGILEQGQFRPDPASGTTQIKRGLRRIAVTGQSHIGTFDTLPQYAFSYLASGSVVTSQSVQHGTFGINERTRAHHLQQGTVIQANGTAAQGYFEINRHGGLALAAGRHIRLDGSVAEGHFFDHAVPQNMGDQIPLPRFAGPFAVRHGSVA